MLTELRVCQLGVIDDLTLVLEPGLTALTGETGAGKTLVVEAIELLLGVRPDPELVRSGANEAVVEGRFSTTSGDEGDDLVVSRSVPRQGRSRAYIGDRMATTTLLSEVTATLVDLHGQHAHQSLLSPAVQRGALDRVAGADIDGLGRARRHLQQIVAAQEALGGSGPQRAREVEMLQFQLDELDAAALSDPDEDASLADEEGRLADASRLRELAAAAAEAISGEGGAGETLGRISSSLAHQPTLQELHDRLRSLVVELDELSGDARRLSDSLEDDPVRLAGISARRQLLRALRRKYGDTLADVIDYREASRARLDELAVSETTLAALSQDRAEADAAVAAAELRVGEARRAGAPVFAAAVEQQLRALAMPEARFGVEIGDDRAGDTVTWMLSANPGEPLLPLAKVASGGELARAMLAARLVLSGVTAGDEADGRVLIFDEVDAGIGGEAAVAVGRALSELGRHHQVLVVTHLAQVAAFADSQVAVRKQLDGGRAVARAETLGRDERVVELARMLSGRPGSATARRHAAELLAAAADGREPARPVVSLSVAGRRAAR
jgi:DNA repair protein RecN (Recombination protein N)